MWYFDIDPYVFTSPYAQIVERGLRLNGIGCVALESGRKAREAVRAFLTDDTCRVFLLGLRQGAAGLTLVRGASGTCRACGLMGRAIEAAASVARAAAGPALLRVTWCR